MFLSKCQLLFQYFFFQALFVVRRDRSWAFVFASLILKTGTLILRSIYYIDIRGVTLHWTYRFIVMETPVQQTFVCLLC